MQGYRDDGVVLRTHKLGEADRIITLLTRQNGRVRAVAKGVRRTKSRFGGRLEPFTHVDVLIHPGRSLDVIQQAEVIRAYGKPLATDYPRYTAGTAMLETAEKFTPVEKEPAIRQFLLLIGGLRALGETDAPDYLDETDEFDDEDEFDGAADLDEAHEIGEAADFDDAHEIGMADADEHGEPGHRAGPAPQ
ncbi:MAG TPA: DNA repair protein RecO, partial [Trebonia sp.]